MTPLEIGKVEPAFSELAKDPWTRQARVVFLTVVGAGLRRGEIRALRWCDVALADPEGARLRVRVTWVCGGPDTPKSQAGERTIALGKVLADELFQHRQRTLFKGDDDRVFCHSLTGGPLDPGRLRGDAEGGAHEGVASAITCGRSTTGGTRRSRMRLQRGRRRPR